MLELVVHDAILGRTKEEEQEDDYSCQLDTLHFIWSINALFAQCGWGRGSVSSNRDEGLLRELRMGWKFIN